MFKFLTPNRVAAAGSVGASVSVGVLAVTGSLPTGWQPTAVLIAALAAKTGVVTKYLAGCQNWDRIQADATAALEVHTTLPAVPEDVAEQPPTFEAKVIRPLLAAADQYHGTAPDDPWPHVDATYEPQVAGSPDPHE